MEYNSRRGKLGKLGTKRRVYTQKFKTESAVLVAKHEKPVSHIAADLGINEHLLRRFQSAREAAGTSPRPFPGRAWDAELPPLRQETKA